MTAADNEILPRRPARVLICTSPKAGSGLGREAICELDHLLQSEGTSVEITTDIQRVREVSQQAALDRGSGMVHGDGKSELVIVAAGGDGTLALIAQNSPPGTVLVPMPLGTENLLSRHFQYTRRPQHVRDTIHNGVNKLLDVGLANGRMFLVMVTCGFDAEVVRAMHLTRTGHINRFSYFGPIMRALQRYRFPPLTVEWLDEPNALHTVTAEQTESQSFRWAMCFNLPRYAASLRIETLAQGDDGQLDFCGLRRGGLVHGLRYLGGIAIGRHIKWRDVTRRPFTRCRITSPLPVAYQIDGDYGGKLPLEIQILPHYLTLRLPSQLR